MKKRIIYSVDWCVILDLFTFLYNNLQKEDRCCSVCQECASDEVYNATTESCVSCGSCWTPSSDNSGCRPKELTWLKFSNPWVITAAFFSTFGEFSITLNIDFVNVYLISHVQYNKCFL